MPPGVWIMPFWGGGGGRYMETYFSLILSREIYFRLKLLVFFMRPQCYSTDKTRSWVVLWNSRHGRVYRTKPDWPLHTAGSIRQLGECLAWLHYWVFRICLSNHKVKKKKITRYWMAYISFINVSISAKSFIWELFQNIGGSVTNRTHSSGMCVSFALVPWLKRLFKVLIFIMIDTVLSLP